MLHNFVEFTSHSYLSGLSVAGNKHRVKKNKPLDKVHDLNGRILANRACVYPYNGYEVQKTPIAGGYRFIAPIYNESGVHEIGGNVIYQNYLNSNGKIVETIHHSTQFKMWVDPVHLEQIGNIINKVDQFLTIWKYPWMMDHGIGEISRLASKVRFIETSIWDQPFEQHIVE